MPLNFLCHVNESLLSGQIPSSLICSYRTQTCAAAAAAAAAPALPAIAPFVTLGCCRTLRGKRVPRGTTRSSSGQRWTPHTSTTRSSKESSLIHAAAHKVALNFGLESVMGCDVVPHVDVSGVLVSIRMGVDGTVIGDRLAKRGLPVSSFPIGGVYQEAPDIC
jgi:hypothetical protein